MREESVPPDQPLFSDPATIDPLAIHARRDPEAPAVYLDGVDEPLRYGELDRRAAQVAHWLLGLGLQVGA